MSAIDAHWDEVISKYKEIQMPSILDNIKNANIIKECILKIHKHIQSVHGSHLSFVHPHVIDLSSDGHIGPHVDSIKFSGKLICGLSLNSSRILRLLHTCIPSPPDISNPQNASIKYTLSKEYSNDFIDYSTSKDIFKSNLINKEYPLLEFELKPRSLYIISNTFRYNYTHEIIGKYSTVPCVLLPMPSDVEYKFDRRISIMIRDQL